MSIQNFKIKIAFTIIICFVTFINIYGQENDSINTTNLQELVVESSYADLKEYTISYIPTKNEKKHSNSPYSLIDRMHLPTLQTNGEAIQTSTGRNVTIFVNGEILSAVELSTFWPMEVKKVEYIEHSDNPRYAGHLPAVNFIMTQYEWGGVTKLSANQIIPNTGDYNLSSKFSIKKFTISAGGRFRYSNVHSNSGSSDTEIFKNIYLDDTFFSSLEKITNSTGVYKNNYWNIAINLKYSNSNKITINHTIGYIGNSDPGTQTNSSIKWSDYYSGSQFSSNFRKSSNKIPAISGNYFFLLPHSSAITAAWSYQFSHNNRIQNFTDSEFENIQNDINEDGHKVQAKLSYTKSLLGKMRIGGGLSTMYSSFKSTYQGSTNKDLQIWQNENSLFLEYVWGISKNFTLSMIPAIENTRYNSGDGTITNLWSPSIITYVSFTDSKAFMADFSVDYCKYLPSASAIGDIRIRESKIFWIQGNPNIKPTELWDMTLNGNWMGNRHFSISASVSYQIKQNSNILTYLPNNYENEGFVKLYTNASPLHMGRVNFRLRYSINHLTVWGSPTMTYYQSNGNNKKHLWSPQYNLGLQYFIGNFLFDASFASEYKVLSDGGFSIWKSPLRWDFGVSYSNGNFNVALRGINLSNTRVSNYTIYSSEFYDQTSKSWTQGRQLQIQLGYTFGYGKRLDHQIDAYAPGNISTSIIGAN